MIPIAAPRIGEAERAAVERVLDSGRLADGPEVRAFEDEFAAVAGTDRAVATANGTAALVTALRALGIGAGDRVLTSPFTFVATANAVRLCGATPVFVDVDPATFDLSPDALAEAVAADPDAYDAVIAVHLYGLPADVGAIGRICDRHDLALIEDAAQAHGARYGGDPVGSFGDVAAFSFYSTKNMTTGEGGMVVTDRDDVADAAARFVNHGRDGSGDRHVEVGHNLRMTSVAAAIGRVQLDRLPEFTAARREHAARLTDRLADAPVWTPWVPDDREHVFHQYTVRHEARDRLADALADAGVDTGVYYPTPVNRQPAYPDAGGDTPVADRVAASVLSLPVHPGLTDADVDAVADAVVRCAREVRA
ncbi:MAG: DegT/DnrJ/EryC1/StrS family aminotransferase [Haloferacaceae archaeon]